MNARPWLNATIFVALLAAPAGLRAEAVNVNLDLVWAERYLWRGMPLNQEYVLQPALTLELGGLSISAWGNVDLTDWGASKTAGYGDQRNQASEIDYYGGYEAALLDDKMTLGFGFSNYTFPHPSPNLKKGELAFATTEIYGTVGFAIPGLNPVFTANVDEAQAEGAAYIGLDLSESIPIVEERISLDLAGHLGWADHKFIETYYELQLDSRLSDWSASASLPLTLAEGVTLAPAYVYSSVMTDELRQKVMASAKNDGWDLDPEVGIFTLTLSLATTIGK